MKRTKNGLPTKTGQMLRHLAFTGLFLTILVATLYMLINSPA